MEMQQDAVVVGVDGSSKDTMTVEWAAAEAERTGVTLHVVWAFSPATAGFGGGIAPFDAKDIGREVIGPIADHVARTRPGLTLTTHSVIDEPATVLVEASRSASVVVLGGRGLGRIAGRLLGSVSQKVAAHAECPVVVVRGSVNEEGPVVVGVELWDVHDHVLQFAFDHARRQGVGVHIVHGARTLTMPLEDPAVRQAIVDANRGHAADLEALLERCREDYPDVPVTGEIVREHPVSALTDEAGRASLLVVGSRGKRGLTGVRLGSVALGILHEAPRVAVVPVRVD